MSSDLDRESSPSVALAPELSRTVGIAREARRLHLLGTVVDAISFAESLECVETIVRRRTPTQHVVLNAAKIIAIHDDPDLARLIESCGMVNADGISIVWASRLLKRPVRERVTGIDLMTAVLGLAGRNHWRVYFLGGQQSVAEAVNKWAEETFPGLQIAGFHSGYFRDEDEAHIVRAIADSKADILLVALPSPRKEWWIHKYLSELCVPFCMGVGGSFDVVAGVRRRAPTWLQRLGLEWFFRLLQEPGRLGKRYLVTNTRFVWLVFREFLTRN